MLAIPTRLKATHDAYGMTIRDASMLCDGVSQSALTAWEAGTRIPAIDGLYNFAITFGVSLDWLCGATFEPYTAAFMLHAEENSKNLEAISCGYNPLMSFIDNHMRYQGEPVPDKSIVDRADAYEDPIARAKAFTVDARANLLVLPNYINTLENLIRSEEVIAKPALRNKYMSRLQNAEQGLKLVLITGRASFPVTLK